jgi:hypothetical protein
MRYTHLDKLFTPEGLIVGAITLVVTVLLCRPKKSKTPSPPATKGMTTYHFDHAVYFSRFRDLRSPYEMRCALERLHMTRFLAVPKDGGLEYVAETVQGGLPCVFRLVYESADPDSDHYALHMRMSWAHLKPEVHDYYRKSAGSWFDLWSSSLLSIPAGTHRPRRQATLGERVAEAQSAESDLREVAGIQRKIVEALRQGATYSTAHKEGGTRIGYSGGAFYQEDFGDNPAKHRFEDEATFLRSLRRFFDWEISRGNPSGVIAEEVAWILILRRLDQRLERK